MRKQLTPKQVARAVQVSESSVKRWCDKGLIEATYTAGGHRRIPLNALLKFLKESGQELVDPTAIGLPVSSGKTEWVVQRAAEYLIESLVEGDRARCRQVAIDLYMAERGMSLICDRVIAPAFEEIGRRWECGTAEVYQERRGCRIAHSMLAELASFLPSPSPTAPVAIGGAVEGDHYSLATSMAELVLRDAQWNATSLGDNLPFATLAAAIEGLRPRLFWLSCSHLPDPERFLAQYRDLYDAFGMSVAFVVGGRALDGALRQEMKYAAFCDHMQHLESFAQTLQGAIDGESAESS